MARFEITKTEDSFLIFTLRAEDGTVLLESQRYGGIAACRNGIRSVRLNSPDDSKYEKHQDEGEKHYFKIIARNGKPVGGSAIYPTRDRMMEVLRIVQRDARDADEVDLKPQK